MLLAAWAATYSAAMSKRMSTDWTSKMGSAASVRSATASAAAKPLDGSSAMVGRYGGFHTTRMVVRCSLPFTRIQSRAVVWCKVASFLDPKQWEARWWW
jgi:hypothetical protein